MTIGEKKMTKPADIYAQSMQLSKAAGMMFPLNHVAAFAMRKQVPGIIDAAVAHANKRGGDYRMLRNVLSSVASNPILKKAAGNKATDAITLALNNIATKGHSQIDYYSTSGFSTFVDGPFATFAKLHGAFGMNPEKTGLEALAQKAKATQAALTAA